MNRKKLSDLAWDVSEAEYRSDPALSYSILSSFFKNGPKSLINKEKVDSPSLRAGSTVDCLLTAPEEFDDRFYVADIDKFSDTIRKIVESIGIHEEQSLSELSEEALLLTLNDFEYQTNWKPETRIKKLIELGSDYYTVLKYSTGKIVISPQEFQEAQQCVITLKTHPFSYQIFECNEDEEILYQLKFKADINGTPMRCMFDINKINHKEKWIRPIDLKTTGKSEEDFEISFESWNYWIQGLSYSEILRLNIIKDDYFKDFEILPFQFCVINKNNLNPLIWEISDKKVMEAHCLCKFLNTWKNLLWDADWHLQNGKFDYSRKSYENNGINPIQLKL